MLYITRHSKARKTMTNQKFKVARCLRAEDSVSLAIYYSIFIKVRAKVVRPPVLRRFADSSKAAL
jgi:hypothetical protein